MVSFPPEFLDSGARVLEAPGEVMVDSAEAAAYDGTAGKMWRWIHRPFARRTLRYLPAGGRILDVGTGPGLMPVYWAVQRPDIKVVALDLSEAMLERARAHAEQRGVTERVRFLVADATDTGLLSGSFDVVVCHYMLHHFADPAKVLREMVRLVRPGGAVLVRDLARPGPVFARLSTLFTAVFLRNDREQNRQYAESLAASLTTRELRDVIAREELTGFDVRGGPVHITAMRRPESAATRNPLTHERLGRMLAGTTVLIALALAQFVSPWFLLVAAGAGLNLALSGLTDRCVVKNLLVKLGLPGERDLGRAEVLMDLPVHPPGEPLSLRRRQPVNPIGVRAD